MNILKIINDRNDIYNMVNAELFEHIAPTLRAIARIYNLPIDEITWIDINNTPDQLSISFMVRDVTDEGEEFSSTLFAFISPELLELNDEQLSFDYIEGEIMEVIDNMQQLDDLNEEEYNNEAITTNRTLH